MCRMLGGGLPVHNIVLSLWDATNRRFTTKEELKKNSVEQNESRDVWVETESESALTETRRRAASVARST